MSKVIGVISLKGGVGKTSTVVSLGKALSNDFGKRVLLVDGNLTSPNLGMHLNLVNPETTLQDVLVGKLNISQAIYNFDGFDALLCSIFDKRRVNPLKLRDKIRAIRKRYDVIIIDSSPSMNDETLAVMMASDDLLVLTTPDVATLSVTIKAVKNARVKGVPIVGLVLNKVYNKSYEVDVEDIESVLDLPVMAVIPHETDVLKAQSKFIPYVSYKPHSKGSVEYKKLAGTLIGERYNQSRIRDYLSRLTPNRQDVNREIYYTSVFKE